VTTVRFVDARSAFLGATGDEEVRRGAVARFELEPSSELQSEALQFLIDAMGDESWRVRKEAVARASHWPDRTAAAAALTHALGEPDNVGRRNAAIEALVSYGTEAVPPIVAALDGRPEHRKVLVDTLGLIADTSGVAALPPLLDDGDPNVRVAAAEALGLIGGGAAQAALKAVLKRGELLLTLAALDGLNKMGGRVSSAELMPLLETATLRAAALEALGRTGEVAGLPELMRALVAPARNVREAAVVATAELHARLDEAGQKRLEGELQALSAIQPLVQALLEGTLGVQRAAARVLGLTRRGEAVRPLTLAIADPELRDAALLALVSIGPVGLESLVALAPDLEGRLRADVYALLPRFGPAASDARIIGLLGEALEDDDPEAASGAAQALGEVGTREALAPLLRALERDDQVAAAAADALGRLGARHYDEVRILISSRGLAGPEAPHLIRVIGLCGREADAAFLRGTLGAESSTVRRAAADALAQVGAAAVRTGEGRGLADVGDALLFALADEAPEVRAAAARAVAADPAHLGANAADGLERAAHDVEMAVRSAAARALAAVTLAEGPARVRAAEVLRHLVDAHEAVAAVPALEALGRLGEAIDEPRLIAALEASDAEIVKAAARGLGGRTSPNARDALERALADRRWDVRRAAALALGEHGPSVHPLLYARRTVEQDPLVLDSLDEAMTLALGRARPR
jgi:HEAT repeat protein